MVNDLTKTKRNQSLADSRKQNSHLLRAQLRKRGFHVADHVLVAFKDVEAIEDPVARVKARLETFKVFLPYLIPKFRETDYGVLIQTLTQNNTQAAQLSADQLRQMGELAAVLASPKTIDVE